MMVAVAVAVVRVVMAARAAISFFILVCLYPSKRSHHHAMHSNSPSLTVNPSDGRIHLLRAQWNFVGDTLPIGTLNR